MATTLKRAVAKVAGKLLALLLSPAGRCALFLLGAAWALLHQWACASTGELKMRGTYFSEAALLSEHSHVAFSRSDALLALHLARNYSRVPLPPQPR